MMTGLDEKLSVLAETVLKRPLDENERFEIFRISDAVGMKDVQSFLHLLLVFKLHEDTMKRQFGKLDELEVKLNEKFGEIAELEKKINGILESSVEKVLGEGAKRIGADMGNAIAIGAKEALGGSEDYRFLRGQVWIVCLISILTTLAYWLGSANALRAGEDMGALETLLMMPSGWIAFVCCSMYVYMWGFDHWKQVKESIYYKGILAFLGLILLALLAFLL
jgi:hypothetical protein